MNKLINERRAQESRPEHRLFLLCTKGILFKLKGILPCRPTVPDSNFQRLVQWSHLIPVYVCVQKVKRQRVKLQLCWITTQNDFFDWRFSIDCHATSINDERPRLVRSFDRFNGPKKVLSRALGLSIVIVYLPSTEILGTVSLTLQLRHEASLTIILWSTSPTLSLIRLFWKHASCPLPQMTNAVVVARVLLSETATNTFWPVVGYNSSVY